MRLATLYLRSRLVGRAALLLIATSVLTWLWWTWRGNAQTTIIMLPLVMPLAAAAVIGGSCGSPFGEGEDTGSQSLGMLRFAHLSGLMVFAAVLLGLAVLGWDVQDSAWIMLRNLAGFTGLALIAARIVGSGLSWVAPLGYALLALGGSQSNPDDWWLWPAQAATNHLALLIGTILLLAGLIIIAREGARHMTAGPV